MKASYTDLTHALQEEAYRLDYLALESIAKLYFPDAVRCEVSQNISNNGIEIDSISFYNDDNLKLGLPTDSREAASIITGNANLLEQYTAGTDEVAFIEKEYRRWLSDYEIKQVNFDDFLHFDFTTSFNKTQTLYVGLPGYVVVHYPSSGELPDAHLASSYEAGMSIIAHLATSTFPGDTRLKQLVKDKSLEAAILHAAEHHNFVCDLVKTS
jgi:hypothetical protein